MYNRATKVRILRRRKVMAALNEVDILVSPISPYRAPKHAVLTTRFENADDVRGRFFSCWAYTRVYSLTALPAISIPDGFKADGTHRAAVGSRILRRGDVVQGRLRLTCHGIPESPQQYWTHNRLLIRIAGHDSALV